jgi:hypothetical protein
MSLEMFRKKLPDRYLGSPILGILGSLRQFEEFDIDLLGAKTAAAEHCIGLQSTAELDGLLVTAKQTIFDRIIGDSSQGEDSGILGIGH